MSEIAHNTASNTSVVHLPTSPQVMATRNRVKQEYKETYHVQQLGNIHNHINNISNTNINSSNNGISCSIVDTSKTHSVELALSGQGSNKSRESDAIKYNALLKNVKVNNKCKTNNNSIINNDSIINESGSGNKYNSNIQTLPSLTLTSSSMHATPKQTYLSRLSNPTNTNTTLSTRSNISTNNNYNKLKNTVRTNLTKKMIKTREESVDKKAKINYISPSPSSTTLSANCIESENSNTQITSSSNQQQEEEEESKSKLVVLESQSSERKMLAPHKPTLMRSLHLELEEEEKSKTDHSKQKQKIELRKRKTKICSTERKKESQEIDDDESIQEKESSKHKRHLSYLRNHPRNIPMMVNRLYRNVLASRPAEPIQFIISALENNTEQEQEKESEELRKEDDNELHSDNAINEETIPEGPAECKKIEEMEIDKSNVITIAQDVIDNNETNEEKSANDSNTDNKSENEGNNVLVEESQKEDNAIIDEESVIEPSTSNETKDERISINNDGNDVMIMTNEMNNKEILNHSQRPPRSPAMPSTITSIQRHPSAHISSSLSTCATVVKKNVNENTVQLLMPSSEIVPPTIQPPPPPPPIITPSALSTHSASPLATPQTTALLNASLRTLQTSLINHNTSGIGKTTTATGNAWSVDEVFAHSNRSTFSAASSVSNLSCSVSSTNSTMMTGSMLSTDVEEFLNELRALKREVVDAHGHHIHHNASYDDNNEDEDDDDEEEYDEDEVDQNELLANPHSCKRRRSSNGNNPFITISQLARIIESASFPLPELSLLSDLFDELCSTTPSALIENLSSLGQTGVTQQTERDDHDSNMDIKNSVNYNNNKANNTQKDAMSFYKRAAEATWNTQTSAWDGNSVPTMNKEQKSSNEKKNALELNQAMKVSTEAVVNFETFLARMALAIQGHYPADIVRRAFFSLSFHENENNSNNKLSIDEYNGNNREQIHSPFPFHEAATRRVVSSADESGMINRNACDKTEFSIHDNTSSSSNNNSRCNSRESDLSIDSSNSSDNNGGIEKMKRRTRRENTNTNQTSSGKQSNELRAFSANDQQSNVANKLYSLTSAALLLYKNSSQHSPLLTHMAHMNANDKATFPMFSELNRSVPLRTCVIDGLVRTLGMVKLTEIQLYKALHMIGIKTHNTTNNNNNNSSTNKTSESTNKCSMDSLCNECNVDSTRLYLNDFIALVQVLTGNGFMNSNVNSPNSVFVNSMCAKSPSLSTSLRGSPWLGNSGSSHLTSSLLLRNARANNNVISNTTAMTSNPTSSNSINNEVNNTMANTCTT